MFDQALALFKAGKAKDAATASEAALKEYPGDANLLCLAARANLILKRLDQAGVHIDKAIQLHPGFAVAHDLHGDLMLVQNQSDAAIRSYEQVIRLDPTRASVLMKIEKAGEFSAVKKPERDIVAEKRMALESEINQAQELHRSGKSLEAEKIYRKILKHDPGHVEAARLLAGLAAENKKYSDAEVFLRHAVGIAPDYGRLWIDLTNVLREQEKFNEALDCADKIVELAGDKAESHMLMASVLGSLNRHEEAIGCYQRALDISPERAGVMCSMAHHLKTVGRQKEGVAMYRKAIASKPDHSEAYWSLANLKTFRFEEHEIQSMESLLEDSELEDSARVQIHNALGLQNEALKNYDQAFYHFDSCNQLRRQEEVYDPVETESGSDRIIEVFNQQFFDEHQGVGSDDDSPIFIVGLPRSGSTLIEQILASHELVDGTHELGDLPRVATRIRRFSKARSRFPENLLELAPGNWKNIADDYIDSTRKYRAGAPFFIDKNPNNFIFVGLLRLIMPGAKIINAIRHPLDSCFGAYKQLFASGQPFTYDFTELGEYYLQYQRLMNHWHEVAPGFVLDVHYENVVEDLDGQVKRILDFCRLPFDENCLRFHETERAVKTASSEQVRKPIYSSSVNLWRNYESHLDELIEILEPILQLLPASNQPENLKK